MKSPAPSNDDKVFTALPEGTVPAGVDRRSFFMRSAVIGASAVLTGKNWTPEARALAPGIPQYRESYAEFLASNQQRPQALAVLEGIAENQRRSSDNLLRLADALDRLHFDNEAAKASRDAVSLEPGNSAAYLALARRLGMLGQIQDALEQFDQAQHVAANEFLASDAFAQRTHFLSTNGLLRDAYDREVAALASRPSPTPAPYVQAAEMALTLDDLPATREWIEKALALNPSSAIALELAAGVYEKKGDNIQAIAALRKLIDLEPANRVACLQRLARNYAQLGDAPHAIESAKAAISAESDNRVSRDLLDDLRERFATATQTAPSHD